MMLNPQQVLFAQCMTLVGAMVRGAAFNNANFPAGDVIAMMSRAMGATVGTIFHGPLQEVLMSRKACREAFIDGLAKSPPPPPMQAPQGQPMTAVLPHGGGNGRGT